jgi:hypothetical protein
MSRNTWPTAPVAPTTAILQEFKVSSVKLNIKPVDESTKNGEDYSPIILSSPTVNPFDVPEAFIAIITPGIKLSLFIESWRIVKVWPKDPKTIS